MFNDDLNEQMAAVLSHDDFNRFGELSEKYVLDQAQSCVAKINGVVPASFTESDKREIEAIFRRFQSARDFYTFSR